MAKDRGDELRALKRVIEVCRIQAVLLDMPALSHILGKAEMCLASHQAAPPPPAKRALSISRDRPVRH